MKSRRNFLRIGGGALTVGITGCVDGGFGAGQESSTPTTTPASTPAIDEIVVSGKNFTENMILGYMTYEVIRNNTDIFAINEIPYGNNAETLDAFVDRIVHTYWDYTGTLWVADFGQEPIRDPQALYEAVKEKARTDYDMRVLDRTSFENTWAFFAKPKTIDETGIETLSDLAASVNSGNYNVTVAVESDFYERPDGWPELTDHYGFNETKLTEWENQGGVVVVNVGLGYDEVQYQGTDIGLGYTTDAQLKEIELSIIEDDKNFWPPYNLVPVVAAEKATEQVVNEINKIPPALGDAATMQQLNARVTVDGENEQQVARSFLQENNII